MSLLPHNSVLNWVVEFQFGEISSLLLALSLRLDPSFCPIQTIIKQVYIRSLLWCRGGTDTDDNLLWYGSSVISTCGDEILRSFLVVDLLQAVEQEVQGAGSISQASQQGASWAACRAQHLE